MSHRRFRLSSQTTWFVLVTATCLFGTSIFCQPSQATKIVRNLKTWSTWSSNQGAGYTFSKEIEAGTNKPTAKIQSSSPQQKTGFAAIFQEFAPTLFAGKKVRFSASIKTSGVNGSAAIWMMDRSGDKVLAFDDMSNRPLTGTHDWAVHSVVLDIPANSDQVRAGLIIKGGGTVWMRDPQLVVANADEKSTAVKFDLAKFTLDKLDPKPANLDFKERGYVTKNLNHIIQWSINTDHGYNFQISPDTLDRGKPSVQVTCDIDPGDGFATMYQAFDAKAYLNKRICFSADLKNTNKENWTTMFVQIYGSESILAFDALEKRPLQNLKNWTNTKIVLDVPAAAKKIKIGFLQAGKGKAWISNLAFNTVSEQIPVTSKPGHEEKLPKEKLDLKPNFDFD